MAKYSSHILELARIGAKSRIKELSDEIEVIRRAFPGEFGLRGGARKPRQKAAGPKRKRTMSAAARKAVSERMRAYWATKRRGKKK